MTAIKIKGNIEITGGSVTASSEATGKPAPSARYDGIYVEGNFTITVGCVKATSENDSGIYVASDDFTIGSDAESVTVRGYYSGVYVENGNLTINGGRIDSYVTGEG